jgi:hypothetical protein
MYTGALKWHLDKNRMTLHMILNGDENKSLYLIFVGVVFSQHLGLHLEQLGQQHLGCFLGQQHLDCF